MRRRRRDGFTLIELLMVIAVISLLASIVVVKVVDMTGETRAETVSTSVSHVRQVIAYQSVLPNVPKSAQGFPLALDPTWFRSDVMPKHTWTRRPMIVETVNADVEDYYPVDKTFDAADTTAVNAWYNAANGSFCIRVGAQENDVLDLFNAANIASITSLNQTTR